MSLQIKVEGRTDVGLVRPGNEDYLHIDRDNNVFAVCDGMGGHQAGEVASMTAAKTIQQAFRRFSMELLGDSRLNVGRTLPPTGDVLLKSTRLANRAIHNRALEQPELSGMGTTIVAVALESDLMSVVHVGDSRAYRLDDSALEPLTRDHSLVREIQDNQHVSEEEASSVVGKNVITRALGVKAGVEVDYRLVRIQEGEKFILCSDGLCGFADDDEIFEVANRFRDNLKEMVDALVQMANDRGGSDNVTVIALEVIRVQKSPLPEVEVFTLPAEDQEALAAEDGWLEKMDTDEEVEEEPPETASGGPRKMILLAIFLVFIVIAVVVIWFLPDG